MRVSNPWLLAAAISGLAAAVLGAVGWHWLDVDDGARALFNMGVQYQMWHTLALLGCAWLADGGDKPQRARWAGWAGWCFAAGIVLFSGSLYGFAVIGAMPVPGAAPLGGILLMAGWAALAVAAVRE